MTHRLTLQDLHAFCQRAIEEGLDCEQLCQQIEAVYEWEESKKARDKAREEVEKSNYDSKESYITNMDG